MGKKESNTGHSTQVNTLGKFRKVSCW